MFARAKDILQQTAQAVVRAAMRHEKVAIIPVVIPAIAMAFFSPFVVAAPSPLHAVASAPVVALMHGWSVCAGSPIPCAALH